LRYDVFVTSVLFSLDGARVATVAGKDLYLWVAPPVAPNIVTTACKVLRDRSTAGLLERYGIELSDPICSGDEPTPDFSRMIDR
jgi:hypothetical protein